MLITTQVLVLLLLAFTTTTSIMDPTSFSQHLTSSLPQSLTLHVHDLGRTVTGHNILAYGLTANPSIPSTKIQLNQLSSYPSSLIISYFHSSDQNSFNLLFGYLVNLMNNYESDYYMKEVLRVGILWFVPYVSIDAYQFNTKNNITQGLRKKNMNLYPDPNQQAKKCLQTTNNYAGVNLNYNFLTQQQLPQYTDICSQNYSGIQPFSQTQTQAIRNLFTKLKINVVIELGSGDDMWVYPYRGIWEKESEHRFGRIYGDVIQKLGKRETAIVQEPTKILVKDNGVGEKKNGLYSGGFINWSAQQNTLSFKYLITPQQRGPKLQKSVSSAYPVIDMLIKKNAPIYNKYRNEDNSKDGRYLYIESVSLQDFTIRCQVFLMGSGESVVKDYLVPVGRVVEINVQGQEQLYRKDSGSDQQKPIINLFVVGTQISQQISIDTLPIITPEKIPQYIHRPTKKQNHISYLMVVFVIMLVCGLGGGIVVFMRKRGNNSGRKNEGKRSYISVADGNLDF